MVQIEAVVVDGQVPTIDYLSLFSTDHVKCSAALARLSTACQDYGFFNLVNHGIPDGVIEGALSGIAEFYEQVEVHEKNKEAVEDYMTRFHQVKLGLARAMSIILGQKESYIETSLNLESGFDVVANNSYPPNVSSKGTTRLPEHTDPGFIISLIQDMDGGLQILTHQGKWINVHIPPNAILIQILTNGKYKSHIHRALIHNYNVRRISIATLHGPSIDKFVAPAPEFVDESHPLGYRGMTYSEFLKANNCYEIEVQSCLEQLRILPI
ncbi:2-oxoglutarate-dependent dioxygenase 19 [Linum perenne]